MPNAANTNFKFNRTDLDRLRNYLAAASVTIAPTQPTTSQQMPAVPPPPPPPTHGNSVDQDAPNVEKMETTTPDVNATSSDASKVPNPGATTSSTPSVQFQQITSYSKLLRPLFNCSSKLGRSLCELFGLQVKLSAGSPWKNTNTRRNMIHHLQNNLNNPAPSTSAVNVATAIANISISGFSNQRFSTFCSTNSIPEQPMPFSSGRIFYYN